MDKGGGEESAHVNSMMVMHGMQGLRMVRVQGKVRGDLQYTR